MHVHMSMCVTRIPSAGGFACPGDGVETARSRTTCSCWTYVREPVLKSAAVLCRGRGLGMAGGVGVRLSAVRRARRPSLRPSTVVRRAARSCAVWRVAQRLPTALRPPAKHSRRARGPRRATARDDAPAPAAARGRAPAGGRRRPRPGPRGVPETVFLQKWSRVLFVLGGITGPRTLQQVFSARASVSARARLRSAVSSVSHSISRCHLASGSAVLQCSSSREPVPHTVAESAPDFPAHVALLPGRRRLSSPPRL